MDKNKRRSTLVAFLFAVISPPLSFLYSGSWKLAVGIFVLPFLLMGILGWTGLVFINGVFIFTALGYILGYLLLIILATRYAKRQGMMRLKRYQRWYVYLIFLVVTSVLSNLFIPVRGAVLGYEPFRIPSGSMKPTLLYGDYIIVDTWVYGNEQPQRGDVIIFRKPDEPDVLYIKRIIGLPGDSVKIVAESVYINDELLNEEYAIHNSNVRRTDDGVFEVGEDEYFVLGDNRDMSLDSRMFGMVNREQIYGKAKSVWFSMDGETYELRLDRLGLAINQE